MLPKGVTLITKQRSQTLENVEKLLLIWINEKQLAGDSISVFFIQLACIVFIFFCVRFNDFHRFCV